jgi:hypothetical protein
MSLWNVSTAFVTPISNTLNWNVLLEHINAVQDLLGGSNGTWKYPDVSSMTVKYVACVSLAKISSANGNGYEIFWVQLFKYWYSIVTLIEPSFFFYKWGCEAHGVVWVGLIHLEMIITSIIWSKSRW